MRDRHLFESVLTLGSEPEGDTPEEFARFIRDDMAQWSKLMKDMGIVPE